jgi:hypothetical protein
MNSSNGQDTRFQHCALYWRRRAPPDASRVVQMLPVPGFNVVVFQSTVNLILEPGFSPAHGRLSAN